MNLAVDSALLGEPVPVVVAQPPSGVDAATAPWAWLLHGHGNTVTDVSWVVDGLATAMAVGTLSPCTIAAPVGPWSKTAWWVDSAYHDGRPVESAVVDEVLPEVEQRLGPAGREQRVVAGLSMGGGAANGWVLKHQELFGSAALAAPAAFADVPPARSADASGAFGVGDRPFVAERWASLMSYRRLLTDR
ncbi:MAG: alpha/beta hydrolase-fold protein [Janthinobacterium lividum]